MTLSSPTAIEPVARAFRVLEVLNRHPTSTLAQISAASGLPKPTVARMLETLLALGYATRVSRQLGYRITDRVLSLAAGMRFIDHLVDMAAPPMSAFTRDSGWPLYLGTIAAGAVLIRYSTAPQSPLSFEATGYAVKIPAHESAIGLAFLAFCTPDERRAILREAAPLGGAHIISARRGAALQRELDDIRARGFASTQPWRPSRLHGIAVPILQGPHVLGALSLRYPKSSMTEAEAAARYVPMLCNVADAIVARAFADHTNG